MNTFNSKSFKLLIRFLIIIVTIALVVTSLSIIPLIIGIIGLIIIPSSFINDIISENKDSLYDAFNVSSKTLSKHDLSDFTFYKPSVIILLILIIGLVTIYMIGIYYVRKWLKNINQQEIFTLKNANLIEKIAYCFFAIGIYEAILGLARYYVSYTFVNGNSKLLSLMDNDVESVADFIFSVNFAFVFAGIIIWIIGRVFKYGMFLQEEYDSTI
ncbi:DUF2975 domain-containing protein [Staphylococcus edaphicus]|nr:DUF2975 domain-containing protein [Staphylococcus edaphicus]UQW80929.1 DUF2975 domain-containing protein [Staphylococcus edaphicus]